MSARIQSEDALATAAAAAVVPAEPAHMVVPTTVGPASILPNAIPITPIGRPIIIPIRRTFAPAWFYSALSFLGYYYTDASNAVQSFNQVLVGSDVDPYRSLGSTRLFVIFSVRNTLRLSVAPDVNSLAPAVLTGTTTYARSDAGILALYEALAATSIFPYVKFCYIPGKLSRGLAPNSERSLLDLGYDPASGLRVCVLGSAVSQVVPLGDFTLGHNEQIYDPSPTIVPVVAALVYDITTNNSLDARTFVLPTYYTPDLITRSYYVNRIGSNEVVNGNSVYFGQTVLFPGGPGYVDASSTPLTLESTTPVTTGDSTTTTYTFDTATVVTTSPSPLSPKVQIGVSSLTYTGYSPSNIFANQNIIGFYRDSTWSTCLGLPMFDFGTQNGSFAPSIQMVSLATPGIIYNPTSPFLNGGDLPVVLRKINSATYLFPSDRLVAILNQAATSPSDTRRAAAGLAVQTASLDIQPSSPPTASILDHLTVPVSVTVVTTPPPIIFPPPRIALESTAAVGTSATTRVVESASFIKQLGPSSVQLGLSASIPEEALSGTGILTVEIGTKFPQQSLGQGLGVEALGTAGGVLNINRPNSEVTALPQFDLATASAGIPFLAGVTYILSLTGASLSVRGSDGTSVSTTVSDSSPAGHTYVGSMVYSSAIRLIPLYPKLQLSLPAPAVGTFGVLQGVKYTVGFTYGHPNSSYDIVDSTQAIVARGVSVPSPTATDGSRPRTNDLYFGSFIGGSSQMTVWNVPVFLTVGVSRFSGVNFNGSLALEAVASGVPSYNLQITDTSLFVYTNINIDSGSIGSLSANNVFLASAVINSAPDDGTSKAFAPSKLVMGLIRQAQVGVFNTSVFIPEDDSVIIGGMRYMLSVITMKNMPDFNSLPNPLPYLPAYWPSSQYWQFANKHNPYLDVEYSGGMQGARIATAQRDTIRIGLQTAKTQEPMHMYLDTDSSLMTVYPIYAFPFSTTTNLIDIGRFSTITSTILSILNTTFPPKAPFVPGPLDKEQITVPTNLNLNNPYLTSDASVVDTSTAAVASSSTTTTTTTTAQNTEPVIVGLPVSNLSPGAVSQTTAKSVQAFQDYQTKQSQTAAASLSVTKSTTSVPSVTQEFSSIVARSFIPSRRRRPQPVYGFSVYNPGSGEAYLIEVVLTDNATPDVLPHPTMNANYDPYYVRVVFLNTLTAYNMSIIVPSMVYDQNNILATQGVTYQNALGQTDELPLGYMYSLYDSSNNFDTLTFSPYPPVARLFPIGFDPIPTLNLSPSQAQLYTNTPYSTQQATIFSPISLFGNLDIPLSTTQRRLNLNLISLSSINFIRPRTPPAYFVCRRKNWQADCHLMQATHTTGSAAYLAFGGGDIVPFSLTPHRPFSIDKRQPAYNRELTYTFADKKYLSAKNLSVGNVPYVVATSTDGNVVQFTSVSIDGTAGTPTLQTNDSTALNFPTDCYIVGQASTTLTSVPSTTISLSGLDSSGNPPHFQVITYGNLVYLIRAVSNSEGLTAIGGLGKSSGLLIDTFVPSVDGKLVLAQAARHKRSGLSFFGSMYTPTTMVESLDNLDYTSITGNTFYTPTIFIPIPEIDTSQGFIADLSNFVGQQVWTFIYPEIVAQPGATVNGVTYGLSGYNIDGNSKPILSLQKLHFVYDSLAVLFTPNDLTHKYTLQPKQQILALSNDQIREGIAWRSANVQVKRNPPTNICAQQILPQGIGYDRANIIYSPLNRPVSTSTPAVSSYMGMSVNSFLSVSGTTYNIEERNFAAKMAGPPVDQSGAKYMAQVSSTQNMLIGALFDYDNNDLGTMTTYDPKGSTKGIVLLNGYQSSSGYTFSSGDHFDVNDVLKSQVPLLDEVANILGHDQAFYNTDLSLPRQYWALTYDTFTGAGLPNYIANAPPSMIDPNFTNRTRSLILSLQNLQDPVQPVELGLMDTYSSVVSVNLRLQNGITGSIFLNKTADRDIASLSSPPPNALNASIFGLPTNYDFFVFSKDHYSTLYGAKFQVIDNGYAMCLVDDGTGTGNKLAKYFVDSDGNYFELYSYVLSSPNTGLMESSSFTLKVTLGTPANLGASPVTPETPNNVSPQDMVNAINKASNLVYAAFGPTAPGQQPAFLPIQAIGTQPQALPIIGAPGFNGYNLNVMITNRQPLQISKIYSGAVGYTISGSTSIQPLGKTGKLVPFYGSISHGLDAQVSVYNTIQSLDGYSFNPRGQIPPPGVFGGAGTGAMIGTTFSQCFQGSPAAPVTASGGVAAGSTMKADETVFYTYNVATSTIVDSTGKSGTVSAGQWFCDNSDPANLLYGVITLPSFNYNGNTCSVNINTTAADGITSRYTLVLGGRSFLFDSGNLSVTVDQTKFTFNKVQNGVYSVTCSVTSAPSGSVSTTPTPIVLTPFTVTAGGLAGGYVADVFNAPGQLKNMVLGILGRQYTYDPVHATMTVIQGATQTTVPVSTGSVFASSSGYGYVIQFTTLPKSIGNVYAANGATMFPWTAQPPSPAVPYPLMKYPKMFTLGGDHYTFNQDASGNYVSVTGNNQTYVVNPYQFSILGEIYIINTQTTPNTVIGGGQTYNMTASNTQFIINGVQYTITLQKNSLNGATISGQFNIAQGNVIVMENYVYQLDTLDGQIVGNGTAYPLTTGGITYTITTAGFTESSYTVTTQQSATTVTIDNVVYSIGNAAVVGDEITYPILPYRTFVDGTSTFNIELDGTVSVAPPLTLSGLPPYTRSTFTDGGTTYTVNDTAAYDGSQYFLMSGSPPHFSAAGLTYTIRSDGVSIAAGASQTYIINTAGPPTPNQCNLGSKTIMYGRAFDVAAFDGTNYHAMANNQFTDSSAGLTYTISGNTAVNQGNSYEIFSNLGQGPYFEVPNGPIYFINIKVADTGSATGDIYSVFPISGGQFTIPLVYTFTIVGNSVSASSFTLSSAPEGTAMPTLTANAGSLTGGYFSDPVTKITYNCVVNYPTVTFVDSNNGIYVYSKTTNSFVAQVVVSTGVSLAVDSANVHNVYPIQNNQFAVSSMTTYSIKNSVAYSNATTGPYWPIANGRFIVPAVARSNVAYTMRGANVTKGYVINQDDQFTTDGNVVYTINAVNVVKATNQATLTGTVPNQTLTAGSSSYTLNSTTATARAQLQGVVFNPTTEQFTLTYSNGIAVTYTLASGSGTVTDNRNPPSSFSYVATGSNITFTDSVSNVTFTFGQAPNSPVTAGFAYVNNFFIDPIKGITYYIDVADVKVEGISYLPETTQYAFTAANGQTYLIHYSDVGVIIPVISGQYVNVGIATVGSAKLTVHVSSVATPDGETTVTANKNSLEINGNLYTIYGQVIGSDYSKCMVAGARMTPKPFTSKNTFVLTDPTVTYTLQLDANNLPVAAIATFVVRPSQNLITVNENVYIITYDSVTTGSLLGQGQSSVAISSSGFSLSNYFDSTQANFIFADLNIYDAASVVGQFTAYLNPTFVIGTTTYTFDTVNLIVTNTDKHPYPLVTNPTMFSINGFNYVIDTNRVPHAIIGNSNTSPLATDVTVQREKPIANSTFTLNGLVYKYTEDTLQNLLTITGTQTFTIAQPALTFKLGSGLLFTITMTAPGPGTFAGSIAPIATITAGTTILYIYAGVPESGNADFFLYKNIMYTLVKSNGVYEAVQKSYTVYAAQPTPTQQQLAVFNLNGTTYMVTDGTTAGTSPTAGINPGTMWAATAILTPSSTLETQFGLVYGFGSQPINVSQSTIAPNNFQFQVTDGSGNVTVYDIFYTPKSANNSVQIDTPNKLPSFTQQFGFGSFMQSSPLVFETGGYNAFSTTVDETIQPIETFSAAYKTEIISSDPQIDNLITVQGDFSVEFWHSTPVSNPSPTAYHPVTYNSSVNKPTVYFIDVNFQSPNEVYVKINETLMYSVSTAPIFSSRWRHFALTYTQPYVILCEGAGYEVNTNATNLNFMQDFSIAMTFAAQNANSSQGLLYKGSGSAPAVSMSYRVAISGGQLTLQFTDGHGNVKGPYLGPSITPGITYRVIISKSMDTAASASNQDATTGATDPYLPPFGPKELAGAGGSGGFSNTNGVASISGVKTSGLSANAQNFLNNITSGSAQQQTYTVIIAVQQIGVDGKPGDLTYQPNPYMNQPGTDSLGMQINNTGSSSLFIGNAFDDNGQPSPLGANGAYSGNVSEVYLFSTAIDARKIDSVVATKNSLLQAGVVGHWKAAYDPNGIVQNSVDSTAIAFSNNTSQSFLAPQAGRELEGTQLYLNGYTMTLSPGTTPPSSTATHSNGSSLLTFNANNSSLYTMSEISMWNACRQPFQVINDMFGRLVASNEPTLALYLSSSFTAPNSSGPLLPMSQFIDNVAVNNLSGLPQLQFSMASKSLVFCPPVARCGPLITPNLYTPPSVALTVADTVPYLTTYSVTLNSVTSDIAGELNEAYVYISNQVLTLYAGKKVGDLVLSWVSQEQGDVQLLGYIEGAPPAPMANLTNKTSYAGATSLTLSTPTSEAFSYAQESDNSIDNALGLSIKPVALNAKVTTQIAPFGFGISSDNLFHVKFALSGGNEWDQGGAWTTQNTSTNKLDESNKYTVKLTGSLAPVTGDLFMSSVNALTTPSTTSNPASKTAILPNPNLGGFSSSNAPTALPAKPQTDEKFGSPVYVPSPYGQAFVRSKLLDVYQQTLVQTGTIYGYVRIQNEQVPPDLNIIPFRMSSKYIRPGCLDGVVGYVYNPATLSNGSKAYTTSTGEMRVLYDKNFSPGSLGHNASYMKLVETYQLKKKIDQEAFRALALYNAAYSDDSDATNPNLTPGLDFYNEYVWNAHGGTQEVKHNYTTTFDTVYTSSSSFGINQTLGVDAQITVVAEGIVDLTLAEKFTYKHGSKKTYRTTGMSSFDITASFDGIENDTQMRYASNNDAHFVMLNNSMFNTSNQSGLNLVIGSDGRVFNIVPSVSSGAGLPLSDSIDDSMNYMQPQPTYSTGNADGSTGGLEPYDRPGKTSSFRSYAFFLQPSQDNGDNFWNTVIDQTWLANSPESGARALNAASPAKSPGTLSVPWRILYRVTDSERFLPPVSNDLPPTPTITPVMAVPVTNLVTDFIYMDIKASGTRPTHNPSNDTESNIVLVAPSASGLSVGSIPTMGQNKGVAILPYNVIPFDLVNLASKPIVNWGDTSNNSLLSRIFNSVLGLNVVNISTYVTPGSTRTAVIMDPVGGEVLYTVYTDPNGFTVNIATNPSFTIYQDVNGNPVQYYDGKVYHSLQADYIASPDGSLMLYIEPPPNYDQSAFSLTGDYDIFGHPGDEWRYYYVSSYSSDMTSEPSVTGTGPFRGSSSFAGFSIASARSIGGGSNSTSQVAGYVLCKGLMQWPSLNTNAETFADVLVYKAMSLWDVFPIGDVGTLMAFLKAQYPNAAFVAPSTENDEISLVFAKNVFTYFNAAQQSL